MTIPRQIGPETGPRRALPDFSRSNATVERMVRDLRQPTGGARATGPVRTLVPADAGRDIIVRCVVAAVALGLAAASTVLAVLLYLGLGERGAPGVVGMLLILAFGAAAAVLTLLGARFLVVAVTTSRATVEVTDAGLRVTGLLKPRLVPWHEILAVESRVVHPVHWLTAALRLRDGSRVIMPAFDRHIWNYGQPSGQDIRALRGELRRREQAAAAASPLPR